MFNKQIRITGKHADILKLYSKDKQAEVQLKFELDNTDGAKNSYYIFDSMIQCYMCAAMIGIIENRSVASDNSKTTPANIFAEIVNKKKDNLMRIYQHMILTVNNEEPIDSRIKKAFTVSKENEDEEEERVNSYVRGGLEIIDEHFKDCRTIENLANKLYDFCDKYSIEA